MKRQLRNLFLLAGLLTVQQTMADVAINPTNFPDAKFRSYISEELDGDHNGTLSDEEIADVYSIDCRSRGITSLVGIKFFTNLNYLYCQDNAIATLDVSGLQDLYSIYLDGTGCQTLIAQNTPSLGYNRDWPVKKVDFSNKGVTSFSAGGPDKWDEEKNAWVPADNALETLILSGIEELEDVDVYRFKNLKTLDLSGNANLDDVDVYNNPSLKSIDFTNDAAISYLNICDNPVLPTLGGLKQFANLSSLNIKNNLAWDSTLDVSGLQELSSINMEGAPIETLIAQNTPSLDYDRSWPVKKVDFSNKGVSSFSAYGQTEWDSEKETYVPADNALETLILSGIGELEGVDVCDFKNLKTLDLSGNVNLYDVNVYNNTSLKSIDFTDDSAITYLDIYKNPVLPTLGGLKLFAELYSLDISNNLAWDSTLDVSGLEDLYYINMEGAPIETLIAQNTPSLGYDYNWPVKKVDFSNKGVTSFTAYGPDKWDDEKNKWVPADNALETLILSGIEEMTSVDVYCFKNLKTLDLSGNTNMYDVDVYNNPALKSIDFTNDAAIIYLNIYDNPVLPTLGGLKLFAKLYSLNISNNLAWDSTLDLSGLQELYSIDMEGAPIETLIAKNTPSLSYNNSWPVKKVDFSNKGVSSFSAYGQTEWDSEKETYVPADNALETFILSGIEEMTNVDVCDFKNLKTLDLSRNANLYDVDVYNNTSLKSIDFTDDTAIKFLDIYNNPVLPTLGALKQFAQLYSLDIRNNLAWDSTLDLSGLQELYSINMEGAPIETLIAKNTPSLGYNYDWPVKKVDFSNKGVSSFTAYGPDKWDDEKNKWVPADNPLETLILSGIAEMTTLDVYDFKNLTTLDLSGNVNLYDVDVNNNPALNTLDVRPLSALQYLRCREDALTWLDLSKNSKMAYWYDNDQPQRPQMELLTLCANKVALKVDKDFDPSKVIGLTTNGKSVTATREVIDGQAYCVVSSETAQATALTGTACNYEYRTGFTYDEQEQTLKVQGTVKSVTKCATIIALSANKVTGTYGQTVNAPTMTVSELYDGTISYTSSKPEVVTVASDGKLTVVGAGEATITVSGTETTYRLAPESKTYTVVIAKASPKFTFANATVEAVVQEAVPTNALNKGVYDGTVKYSSSNETVAKVEANGKVTTLKSGTVTITASGEETANCNKPTAATYTLIVKKRAATITLAATTVNGVYGGQITAPKATVTNGFDGNLTYTSSNEAVVKVDNTGKLVITGAGEATITVSSTETDVYSAATPVSFKAIIAKATPEFSFDQAEMEGDAEAALEENVLETGVYDGKVVYTSSDTKIATVDANTGEVTMKMGGTVTITATGEATKNCNAATASYTLTVYNKGDVNHDKVVDVADIATVIDEMAEGTYSSQADVNRDKVVDVADIANIIDIMAYLARLQKMGIE